MHILHTDKNIKYFTITKIFVNIFTRSKIINNLGERGSKAKRLLYECNCLYKSQ